MFGASVRKLFGKSKRLAELILSKAPAADQPDIVRDAAGGSSHLTTDGVESAVLATYGVRADLRFVSWSSEGLVLSGWASVGGETRHAPQQLELHEKPSACI